MHRGLDLTQARDVHSQGQGLPKARPSVPEQHPPSHMTKPTLSGTFRGSPGQPGTFQPACLQGRGRAHRLAAVPGPQPEAHEATAHPHRGPGGSRNRPSRLGGGGGGGGIPPVPRGSLGPCRRQHSPLCLLPGPTSPQSLLGLPTLPGETPNPQGLLSGQPRAVTAAGLWC